MEGRVASCFSFSSGVSHPFGNLQYNVLEGIYKSTVESTRETRVSQAPKQPFSESKSEREFLCNDFPFFFPVSSLYPQTPYHPGLATLDFLVSSAWR